MTCAEFQQRLSAHTDGELTRWTRWKVDVHLRACDECSRLYHELEDVDAALVASIDAVCEGKPAADYITDAVMRRLPAMPPAPRNRGVRPWVAGLALATMQIFALMGAYWWGFATGGGHLAPAAAGVGLNAPFSTPITRTNTSPDRGIHPMPGWVHTDERFEDAPAPAETAPEKPKVRRVNEMKAALRPVFQGGSSR